MNYLYRFRYFYFLILAIQGIIISSTNAQNNTDPPNILWIVSEDNSPLIGAYGDAYATTPNIDQLAKDGVLYENAFSNAPVCSPARSTLITGVYATSIGTQNMRSKYPIPEQIRFFPEYLKKAGYYTTNNAKTDYNTSSENKKNMSQTWDESGRNAHYKNKDKDQPFFAVYNLGISHESSLFPWQEELKHDKEKIEIPPYLPKTPEMKHDAAQYYDVMERMDAQVGKILDELKESGLYENTIIFYFSDHGGVLGRSKQYLYDSGLHIPLIIKFPDKYRDLSPSHPGTKIDHLVSFVDFAPSVLNMLDIEIPEYMEGKAFLGKVQPKPNKFIYVYKDRMDERYDMSRGVRSKEFFYRRNYMPQRIYGQFIQYYWRTPSIRTWERAYKNGQLNKPQSVFWESKPMEELYSVDDDPHNIHNLVDDPQFAQQLEEMRNANLEWELHYQDIGFIPEPMIDEIAKKTSLYEYVRSGKYPLKEKISIIHKMYEGDLTIIRKCLKSDDPVLRYWAIMSSSALYGTKMEEFKKVYKKLTDDKEDAVRLAASEALYRAGYSSEKSISTLIDVLKKGNVSASIYAMDVMEVMGKNALPALPVVKDLILYRMNKTSTYEIRAGGVRLIETLSQYTDSAW